MAIYGIQSGDTLSALAMRFHTSVSALQQANPSIQDPNLIFAGASLNVPGATDSFESGGVGGGSAGIGSASGVSGIAPGASGTALSQAQALLGQDTESLKTSGPLAQFMDPSVSDQECCANFVSSCLEASGEISPSQHNNGVAGLASTLASDPNWSATSLANAKPGDVVCFNVPGEGPMSHVEMFEGFKDGQPVFIGSNNVNADGSQRVSDGNVGYPIGAIYHYDG